MHPKIKAWLDVEKQIGDLEVKSLILLNEALNIEFPKNLRPAKAEDICLNAVIYYPTNGFDNPFWNIVDELLHYGDQWKAYVAHDGCRYGLHGAFVEDKPV